MFKVGEKVRFLDDVGQGTIVRFKDEKTAIVENEFGMHDSYPISKLVPAERDRVTEKPRVEKPLEVVAKAFNKSITDPSTTEQLPELALVFVSNKLNDPETGDLELLFVNNSRYHVLANVGTKNNEEWFSLFHGEVFPLSETVVQSLRRQDVGAVSNLHVDVIFFGTTGYESRKPISCNIKIKATRFVKSGNYLTYEGIENPAFAIAVENEKVNANPTTTPISARTLNPAIKPSSPKVEEEVDLHLEKLSDADMKASNHEKLQLQLRHFEWHLDRAISKGYLQITFIHGIGKERLKAEIRAKLDQLELRYTDGPNFNIGSTVVLLRQ